MTGSAGSASSPARVRYFLLLVLLSVGLAACTGGSTPVSPGDISASRSAAAHGTSQALRLFYDQQVSWSDCGSGYQCTRIRVPRDYLHPGATSISLAVTRRPASDQAARIGALLVNPGGPGVSGISYARNAQFYFSQSLLDHYDIVGWDPRGVGASTAVDCVDDSQLDTQIAADGTPDTPAEVQQVVSLYRTFVNGCKQRSGNLIPYIGTPNSARDIDILRAVLGEKSLDYFGASYGTELGAEYANLFPHRVGRMVLDGALDPALTDQQLAQGQLQGFQQAITSFVDDCISRPGCPVGPTEATAMQQIQNLLSQADAHPLSGDGTRVVTESLATTGIIAAMYDQASGWPALRIALSRALQGDGSVLLQLADSYTERGSNGHYQSNINEAFPAISCTDRPSSETIAQVRRTAVAYARISPLFGRSFAWSGLGCNGWPAAHRFGPTTTHAKGAAPILVIGTTRDPATPYQWAVDLAKELDSGVLLTRNGDGHTGYMSGNACIDSTVDGYLVDGTVPANGKSC